MEKCLRIILTDMSAGHLIAEVTGENTNGRIMVECHAAMTCKVRHGPLGMFAP